MSEMNPEATHAPTDERPHDVIFENVQSQRMYYRATGHVAGTPQDSELRPQLITLHGSPDIVAQEPELPRE